MKLAFDKLNQHRIIIQKEKQNQLVRQIALAATLRTFHLYLFPSTLYGDASSEKMNYGLN